MLSSGFLAPAHGVRPYARQDPEDVAEPAAAGSARDPSGRRRRLRIVALAVLGTVASAAVGATFANIDLQQRNARFDEAARDYQQSIGRALERVTELAIIERTYFETSEHPVTRAEFARFSRAVRETVALGLRDTTWAPRVTAAGRADFELAVRGDGFPTFEVRERDASGVMVRAGDRAEYFPALYIDPPEVLQKVHGFDLGSEPARLQALTRANETGLPTVTSRIHLTQMKSSDLANGFMTFLPVYRGAGDQRALMGCVVGVINIDKLVEQALADKAPADDLDVYLFDIAEPPGKRMIYWHPSRAGALNAAAPSEAAMRERPHAEARVRVADRAWGVLIARAKGAKSGAPGGRGLTALLLGLALTAGGVTWLNATLRHALDLEALTARLRRSGADLATKGEQIAHLARHDILTGLPNRILFLERLNGALAGSPTEGGPCVLCLDLDRFKAVNDTFGHPAGDALLALVGARLRTCLRAEDTAARMGGDEFAILLERHDAAGAEALARRLVETIGQPYQIRGNQMSVGVSVGIALASTGPDGDADVLMRNADLALYRAKQAGRGTWCLFAHEMEAQAQARRTMAANLRRAVEDLAFEVHFQPVIRLTDRRICGFEALLRWNCPGIGPVSPAKFIPLAEECGLIIPLGTWVLQTACREAARWPVPVRVAVNLSPAQFNSPTLVACVQDALAASGLDSGRLELEITETLLLQDSSETLATLYALKQCGASISMDDFGTGYSSLSYLCKFPFDTLKIDQSFVRDMPVREDCRAIVHATTGLCRRLGITTIAEGIETAEQLHDVIAENCDQAQGYLFSRPVPMAQVAALLADQTADAAA